MATLTVTHTESLVLDGRDRSASKTFTVSDIAEIYERTLTVPTTETVLVAFDSTVEGAAVELPTANAKYIRITNVHASNSVELGVIGAATNYQVTLVAGQSHILGAAAALMLAEADTDPSFGTMSDVSSIEAKAISSAATVEVYVASISS